ncbi:MAG TPA: NnrS family protein [Thiomicrorhabdus sp.]|nr:NnrS family protein [Thiomicrorhabdus sp.]
MTVLNLDQHKKIPPNFSLFNLGFRPFFLGAGLISILSMFVWYLLLQQTLQLSALSSTQWHSHEIIFGFSMAVITGFLLTAVKNWTNIDTPSGRPLLLLFLLWASARVAWLLLPFLPENSASLLVIAAVFDLAFSFYFALAFARPVFLSKQWNQIGLLVKVVLMGVLNTLCYLGLLGVLEQGMSWGIYGGFFIILAIILTMGRRVIPFFIEKGVAETVSLKNPKWIDHSSLVLFLLLALSEVFLNQPLITSLIAAPLFIVGCIRLFNWHTAGIWQKSMLWSLYLGMGLIQVGFLLFALTVFSPPLQSLAIHTLAVGGIGLITLGMMTRVTLGHTGRNVNQPPAYHTLLLSLLLLATVTRVLLPLMWPEHYATWITLSQFLWITAYAVFVITFAPMLIKKRIDGHFG